MAATDRVKKAEINAILLHNSKAVLRNTPQVISLYYDFVLHSGD
jgi:hypothetical protein